MGENQHTRYTDHQAVAWKAEVDPGVEVLVNVYDGHDRGDAVARGIRSGRYRAYAPAGSFEASAHPHADGTAVWTRFVAGTGLAPLPKTMTVRVPDYGPQRGYEGVRIVDVEVSARCPQCGGPRGPKVEHRFRRDGEYFTCDRWMNPCGHVDQYDAVLEEARLLADLPEGRTRPCKQIKGVEGGKFAVEIAVIGEAREINPWLSALAVSELLSGRGHEEAARLIRDLVAISPTGGNMTARSAAAFLVQCEAEALAAETASQQTTGDTE
ncbi:hypothetical protein [Streptomyces parvulus]|uniref:hypothetical protein n=1 Tax=Streptomyces parvulus TaxID=146923 RepID=UPI003816F3D7